MGINTGWGGGAQNTALGETTLSADGSSITVTLSSVVADDQYLKLMFNFELVGNNLDIKLFLNGDTNEAGYFVNGVNNARIYTNLLNGALRSGFLNIGVMNSASTLYALGTGVIWDTGSLVYFKDVTANSGIQSITLYTAGSFKAGSNLRAVAA